MMLTQSFFDKYEYDDDLFNTLIFEKVAFSLLFTGALVCLRNLDQISRSKHFRPRTKRLDCLHPNTGKDLNPICIVTPIRETKFSTVK